MLSYLNELDTQLFWWINTHYNTPLDWIMWLASNRWVWDVLIPLVAIFLMYKQGWKRWWLMALGVILCFLLSDRISVMGFKDVVQRLRPCYEFEEGVRMFRTNKGGLYGFVSSHAANCMAVAMFFTLIAKSLPNRTRFIKILPYLFFGWALLVCYSRPYLGKHYPGDCLCGSILGLAVGAFVYFVYAKVIGNLERRSKSAPFLKEE